MTPQTRSSGLGAALYLGLAAWILASCVPKPQPPEGLSRPQAALEAMDTDTAYAEGLNAFWRGDYWDAARLFENLARREDDLELRSKALYGLACARLASAGKPEELKKAREAWLEWERSATGGDHLADPRLLTPFIVNFKGPGPQAGPIREPRIPKPPSGDQDCLKRLQDKEKEVTNLQKQIKALETIHREIQEKKKMTQ